MRLSFERYALIMQQFLMLCGSYREELAKEVNVNDRLNGIALEVKLQEKAAVGKQEMQKKMRDFLKDYSKSLDFQQLHFALDNRLRA